MSDTPRDTQFSKSAHALYCILCNMQMKQALEMQHGVEYSADDLVNAVELLFAQYAYDIAKQAIQSQAQGIELIYKDNPDWIAERIEMVSDITGD